jgi:hypothetical protein
MHKSICISGVHWLLIQAVVLASCSDIAPKMLRGTGISASENHLMITLNAGILETAADRMSGEEVRRVIRLMEDEFARANSGISLRLIVDQPADAFFIMKRMSGRYRSGPAPRSVLDGSHAEAGGDFRSGKNIKNIKEFLSGIQESNPYYLRHRDGTVFLASGLQMYAGGQVHYDLIILSQPIMEDRPDAWICCSLQDNVRDYVLFAAPGRSALDGVAVAAENDVNHIRRALQRLIGTGSQSRSQWKLSASRVSLFRLYAARNGELSRDECGQLSSASNLLEEMEGLQRVAIEESFREIKRFCGSR